MTSPNEQVSIFVDATDQVGIIELANVVIPLLSELDPCGIRDLSLKLYNLLLIANWNEEFQFY